MYLGSSAAPLPVAFAAAQAESFSGTGAQAAFTLSRSVLRNIDIEVIVNNVQQSPYDGSYSVNGTTLTFSENPSAGANNIYVIYRDQPVGSINPIDGSVTTTKLAANAVTPAKMVNSGFELGMRNRIINGGMAINQRAVTSTTTDGYLMDRWRGEKAASAGVYTYSTSTDAPAGFSASFQITTTTADSALDAAEYLQFAHFIEGVNTADLAWGTASAQPVTLSFWFKASQTGTYAATVSNDAGSMVYTTRFTVLAAGTWEFKAITIPGPTSGTFLTNNLCGIGLRIGAAYGSNYTTGAVVNSWNTVTGFAGAIATTTNNTYTTTGAYMRLTGVQLEKGSTATPFEFRPYGTELALCQRYCVVYGGNTSYERFGVGVCQSTTVGYPVTFLPVEMRSAPTVSVNNVSYFALWDGLSTFTTTSIVADQISTKVVSLNATVASGLVPKSVTGLLAQNTTLGRMTLSSEL